jgi:protein-export membrane protein SecD
MRQLRWRAVVVAAVLVATGALIGTRSARLGLDLRGGTQIALEARDTGRQKVDGDTMDRTLEVLRRRVDQLGVAEPSLQRSGDRRIIVELPGLKDPDQAVAVIGQTAQLAFHPVIGVQAEPEATATSAPDGDDEVLVLPDEDGNRLRLAPAALTGDAVRTARATFQGSWHVEVGFRGGGQRAWETLTGTAACAPPGDPVRRVAIALDQKVISSPQVSPEIACNEGITGGTTVITGGFSQTEAKDLALLIRAGALPVPVEIVEQRTIGPTLGKAAIRARVQAALIGAALTILYMIAYYRLLGVLAALALAAYGAVSFAVLLALEATLTLPGIAGFVLAIGMAVDANVLLFERIKEEHAAGASVRLAARNGFRRAWTAIVDSNATTALAAMLLFFYASGAVRGFGITLTIGVVVSMFTALVVTRLLVDVALRSVAISGRPRLLGLEVGGRLRLWLETRRPDLMGRSRRWLALSGVMVILALGGLATRGLDYGLEFSGGRLVVRRGIEPTVQGGSAASDFGDDCLGWLVPDEGFWVFVPVFRPGLDGVGEGGDAVEGPAAESFVGDLFEPAFDEVQPGTRRGCEVEVPPFSFRVGEPVADLGALVGGKVVEDDMDVEVLGDLLVDLLEEGEHVDAGVTLLAVGDDLAGADVQGGEEVGGAVALVVVGHRPGPTRLHRQRRLRPVQGLALGLLVEGEDRSPFRRVQVQGDDVGALLLETRIVRDFEGGDLPRLQLMITPDPSDGVLTEPQVLPQRACRPMRRGVGRQLLLSHPHHLGDRAVRQTGLAAPTRSDLADTLNSLLLKAFPPADHRLPGYLTPASVLPIGDPVSSKQQRLRLLDLANRQRRRTRHRLQLGPLLSGHHQRRSSLDRHIATLPCRTISQTDH